jgi:hypothetical protein
MTPNLYVERMKAAKTAGEVMNTLIACPTREDAVAAMNAFREDNPHADANVGYMLGYYDPATKKRLQEWLSVSHPIFGAQEPTPEEAFEMGRQAAEGGPR